MEADVVHTEMVQADAHSCAEILAEWWSAVGWLPPFPAQWKETILCPLFKRGCQEDAAN